MPQLLKPVCLVPVLCNKRSHCNEKPMHGNEEWPPLAATRESPRTETKTQHSQKLINKQMWGLKKKKKLKVDTFRKKKKLGKY